MEVLGSLGSSLDRLGRALELIWELPGLSWKLPWEVSGHLKLIWEILASLRGSLAHNKLEMLKTRGVFNVEALIFRVSMFAHRRETYSPEPSQSPRLRTEFCVLKVVVPL